ncbi:putative organic solute transporter subunit alpha [Apostichopus japonicus]|uniref:Putative organic solute transporter subunit alpha n=1 Tax=Stichopus japonicus TaxID=307972 RepID=A0A2G8KY98_STIJA|nr:putative organic solute transporter subunit alpha [Apostichopus japonicus]
METWSSFLLIVAFISTFITVAIYIYALVKVRQHNPLGSQRRGALQLVFGLFPVFALTSLCGIIIPRAAYSVEWGASVYLAITIYSFLGLVTEYFGGTAAMMKFFEENKVSYAQPPFACCCVCLPEVYMDDHYCTTAMCLHRGPFSGLTQFEENSAIQNTDALNFWLGTVAGFSTGIAVYGIQVFSKSSNHYLKQYYVRIKLTVVLLVLILTSTVAFVLDVMSFAGSIPCQPAVPSARVEGPKGTLTVDKQTNDTQSDQQDTQTDDKQDTQTDGKQDTQTVENHNSADQTATEIVDTQGL